MFVLSIDPGLRLLTLAVFEPTVGVDNLNALDYLLDIVCPGFGGAFEFRFLSPAPASFQEPNHRKQQKHHSKTPAKLNPGVNSKI